MKILVIILAIYSIALTALPCDDNANLNDQKMTSVYQNNDNSHNANDLCSPFCICSCCAGFVLKPTFQHIILKNTNPSKKVNAYYSVFFTSNYNTSIYQPPQV